MANTFEQDKAEWLAMFTEHERMARAGVEDQEARIKEWRSRPETDELNWRISTWERIVTSSNIAAARARRRIDQVELAQTPEELQRALETS